MGKGDVVVVVLALVMGSTVAEVERYMAWFRSEYRGCRRKTSDAIRFSQRELAKATGYYSALNVIGEGGFGTVYRGQLPEQSRPVAVKRLRLVSREVLSIINTEVGVISQNRHPHLLKLIGWSLALQDPVVVYEYLPNGNLREHLDGLRGLKLNWGTRMKIAIEVAQALTNLHCSFNTIHRDVKSTNILLDEYFSAKLTGYGVSKSLPIDCNKDLSTLPVCSPGYVDPHYLLNYEFTMKSDVYSFGVVLLELVSGMQVVDTRRPRNKLTLAALAISRVKSHRLSELFEPYLIQTGAPLDLKQWKKVALLALQCVRMEPEARPSMKEILDTLRELRPMFAHNYPATGTSTLFLPRTSQKQPVTDVESSLKFLAWGNQQLQRNLLLPAESENAKASDDPHDESLRSDSAPDSASKLLKRS